MNIMQSLGLLRQGRLLCLLLCLLVLGTWAYADLYETVDGVTPPGLPAGWAQIQEQGTENWESVNLGAEARSEPNVLRLSSAASETHEAWLVSPAVNVTSNFVAQFYLRHTDGAGEVSFELHASTNGTAEVGDFDVAITNMFLVATNDWGAHTFSVQNNSALESLIGETDVHFAFRGIVEDGGILDLDNILLARGLLPGLTESFAEGLGAGWKSTPIGAKAENPEWLYISDWGGHPAVLYNSKDKTAINHYSARLSNRNYLDAGGTAAMILSFDIYHFSSGTHIRNVELHPQYSLNGGIDWIDAGPVFMRDTDDYPGGWVSHDVLIVDTNFLAANTITVGFLAKGLLINKTVHTSPIYNI